MRNMSRVSSEARKIVLAWWQRKWTRGDRKAGAVGLRKGSCEFGLSGAQERC